MEKFANLQKVILFLRLYNVSHDMNSRKQLFVLHDNIKNVFARSTELLHKFEQCVFCKLHYELQMINITTIKTKKLLATIFKCSSFVELATLNDTLLWDDNDDSLNTAAMIEAVSDAMSVSLPNLEDDDRLHLRKCESELDTLLHAIDTSSGLEQYQNTERMDRET